MSPQLIAEFTTQFAAMAAVNKLLSCGLEREHIAVQAYGCVGKSAAGASTSTSVISNMNDQGGREDVKPSNLRYPSHLPQPAQFGQAQVTVELNYGLSEEDVRFILELSGAQLLKKRRRKIRTRRPQGLASWPSWKLHRRETCNRRLSWRRIGTCALAEMNP
jgi:hypothetical protein